MARRQKSFPPTVRIISPADQAVFRRGEPIVIKAEAHDQDGSVQTVEFFADAASLGSSAREPYQTVLLDAAVGPLRLIARATDDDGAAADSAPIEIYVGGACGGIAIIGHGDDREPAMMADYFLQAGIRAVMVPRIEELNPPKTCRWPDDADGTHSNNNPVVPAIRLAEVPSPSPPSPSWLVDSIHSCYRVAMTITIKDTDRELNQAAERSLRGEEVVLQKGEHSFVPCLAEPLIRPPGYFEDDYTEEDIRESNATLAQSAKGLLP